MRGDMDNMELNEMREQIALLRAKLQQQEIISESAIMSAVKKGVKNLNGRGLAMTLFDLFAVPFCCVGFAEIGMSAGFVAGTAIMLIICVLVTIYAHFGLNFINVSRTNLVQVGLRTTRLRKIYKSWLWFSVPVLIVWCYFLYRDMAKIYGNTELLVYMLAGALIGGLIGGTIGLWIHFRTLHEADEVLKNIKELQQLED